MVSTPALFAELPSRNLFGSLSSPMEHDNPETKIQVWRNHMFETVASMGSYFGSSMGLDFRFDIRDYDDSFSFVNWSPHSLEILWIDPCRYESKMSTDEYWSWLRARIAALRRLTTAPILVLSWYPDFLKPAPPEQPFSSVAGVQFVNLEREFAGDSEEFLDFRTADLAGSKLSAKAQLLLARKLALQWIPASTKPSIKAIILDLDNTLYSGVLGEDGPEGIAYTTGHQTLHRALKELSTRGVFLALASKNDDSDVVHLWKQRTDFLLRIEDFADREVSWSDKVEGVVRMCEKLRISPDAVLFVDDNYGELLQISEALPSIHTVHAQEDADVTARAVEMYPGIFRWKTSLSSRFRAEDLASNGKRAEIQRVSRDETSYFRKLGIGIELYYDYPDHFARSAEMIRKTNQFNLSLARSDEATVATFMNEPLKCMATVALSDRLSESGVICVVLARVEGAVLFVEELNLSCRALGRGVEDTVVFACLKNMEAMKSCTEISFRVTQGPRNGPALLWLRTATGVDDFESDYATIDAGRVASFRPPVGVRIQQGGSDDQTKY